MNYKRVKYKYKNQTKLHHLESIAVEDHNRSTVAAISFPPAERQAPRPSGHNCLLPSPPLPARMLDWQAVETICLAAVATMPGLSPFSIGVAAIGKKL
jgi:hypothetical protein